MDPAGAARRSRSEWTILFISALRKHGNVRKACVAADVDRRHVYRVRDEEDEFRRDWDDAIADAVDSMEEEADRRAIDGVPETVFYQGEKCGEKRRYSDALLMFRLEGLRPEKYRRQTNVLQVNAGEAAAAVLRAIHSIDASEPEAPAQPEPTPEAQ